MDTIEHAIFQAFQEKFSQTPIVVKAPGRINLIGEHLDYNDGFVFPAAIDKVIVAAMGVSNTSICTAVAVDLNETFEFNLLNIKPLENGGWRNYILGVVHEVQQLGKKLKSFNLSFGGNIPAGSGLSSSAALENSVVFALNELFELELSKEEMIFISQRAEHHFAGVKCGIMDQFASMFGEDQSFLYLDCRSLEVIPYRAVLDGCDFVLINTNVTHSLADSAYNDRRNVTQNLAKLLKVEALRDASFAEYESLKHQVSEVDYQKGLYVLEEIERTQKAAAALEKNDSIALGNLIFESHRGLQHQYQVSCEELDFLVDLAANDPHVLGARMMGGGFGGCTINLVEKQHKKCFIDFAEKAYLEQFGKSCTIIEIEISEGTRRIL